MSADDRQRWDDRYRNATPSSEISPPAGLRGLVELLPMQGRALDIACGGGVGSVWLAHRGLDVIGVDVSPVAIEQARGLTNASGTTDQCTFVVHDLDLGIPETEPMDLVLCHRFNDPSLDSVLLERLQPGGVLALTVLSEVEAEPGPFRVPAGDLIRRFADAEIVHHREAAGDATIIVRTAGPEPLGRLD